MPDINTRETYRQCLRGTISRMAIHHTPNSVTYKLKVTFLVPVESAYLSAYLAWTAATHQRAAEDAIMTWVKAINSATGKRKEWIPSLVPTSHFAQLQQPLEGLKQLGSQAGLGIDKEVVLVSRID